MPRAVRALRSGDARERRGIQGGEWGSAWGRRRGCDADAVYCRRINARRADDAASPTQDVGP
eukprot:3867761-Pyramimonas_sp.AAC.1